MSERDLMIDGVALSILNEPIAQREDNRVEKLAALIQEQQSPRGGLGLPRLLDERRIQYGIPDSAFDRAAVYDRVYLYQVATNIDAKESAFKGSKIILTETAKKKERDTVPTAVIVGAGPIALDHLRSHGMQLGDLVEFVVSAPYFVRFDIIQGVQFHLIVVKSGDITGDFDLQARIRAREVSVAWDAESQSHLVRYYGENHKPLNGERYDD